MFAFASFTISFIGALLYLVLYRELHRKRPGHFYSRLTSLEQLDRVNLYSSLLGVIFLAIAIYTGFNWMREIHANDLRLDARIVATWFTLAVFLTGLLVRRFTRASGRTLSLLSIAGFVLVILAFAFEGISR
jgi:HemX protein